MNFHPVHYNFSGSWLAEVWRVRNKPNLVKAFKKIQKAYEEIAEFKFYDAMEFDVLQAEAELELDKHKAKVLCHDLEWLRTTFESDTLADLSLAIAKCLYPHEAWEIIGDDAYVVVANQRRTMVFDMKNSDKVSANVSLALAGDLAFLSDDKFVNEYEIYNEQKSQEWRDVLELSRHRELALLKVD